MNELYTQRLRSRMTELNLVSYRALAQAAQVSDWTIRQLRAGQADQLRGAILHQLAIFFDCSVTDLLREFSPLELPPFPNRAATAETIHRAALETLETWLRQWPTVVAAIAKNPDLPASRLVPLLKPLENLLTEWDVVAIATVGEELPFDPQWHQLLEGQANPGDRVRVRYVGYCYQGKLLYRAQVSPI